METLDTRVSSTLGQGAGDNIATSQPPCFRKQILQFTHTYGSLTYTNTLVFQLLRKNCKVSYLVIIIGTCMLQV